MSSEVQAFANGFPIAVQHAGVTLLILVVAAALHSVLSPAKEIGHIREGNHAAAVSFGGVLLALSAPLAVSMLASSNIEALALWGGASALLALILFRVIDVIFAGLPQRVQEGEISAAVLLVAAKLAAALILAAAVAG